MIVDIENNWAQIYIFHWSSLKASRDHRIAYFSQFLPLIILMWFALDIYLFFIVDIELEMGQKFARPHRQARYGEVVPFLRNVV